MIISSEDWRNIDWLEEESQVYNTQEKEKKDFGFRIDKAFKSNVATYKNQTLIEPSRESGVFALIIQLSILEPGLFPFEIVDYDTHSGLDIIVKGNDSLPIYLSKLYYVELKYFLSNGFNHSFENLNSIICWDTNIKNGDMLRILQKNEGSCKLSHQRNKKNIKNIFWMILEVPIKLRFLC